MSLIDLAFGGAAFSFLLSANDFLKFRQAANVDVVAVYRSHIVAAPSVR